MAERKYIVFALGKQRYCMMLSGINGLEQTYNIVPVPMGSEYIKGIIHLRNIVIPVYDIKRRFGIDDEPEVCNRQMMIAETHGIRMGIEVDDVLGIVAVPEEDIKEIPAVVRNEDTDCMENAVRIKLPEDDNLDIMLSISIDHIMSDNDFDNVSNALSDVTEESE